MNKPRNGHPVAQAKNPEAFRVIHRNGQLKVLDAKDRPVNGIIGCDLSLRPGVPPLMRMNLAAGAFEVEGVPQFQVYDPKTQRVRPVARIVFSDGGEDFVTATDMPAPMAAPPAPPAPDAPKSETAAQGAPNGNEGQAAETSQATETGVQAQSGGVPPPDGSAAGGGDGQQRTDG